MELLSKSGFWDHVAGLFDIIPKLIYFLYAALASAVDAIQSLVRKLAGLDTYWASTSGGDNKVTGQDPLSEFVYGIIGVGKSATVYRALNTVFWSLAIFGLIMLVVSTMIAIIKSHYNEDTAGTSPWKYIYTAVKAILTFCIIPVTVVIGMQLSTFALTTLDKIVSGSSDEGAIAGIYNSNATTLLEKDSETGSYSHYDCFGAQEFTTTTPFSGMLFKASAYNANRARNSEAFTNLLSLGSTEASEIIEGTTMLDKTIFKMGGQEDVAYQVDYAFANCLMYNTDNRPKYQDWQNYLKDEVYVGLLDMWKPGDIGGFTKWNVSTVWLFYNLWQFNFIVGFVGVTACFGIFMSIAFGLLTRLIKGAALFIIFPALLGIAPMDNFKAFKSWASQFMQQILMVFGAVLGLNLLMLILPYIQNISFFDPGKAAMGVLNAIMDVVILVCGLQMAKDFINIVNGFVGGADALGAGDAVKEGTKNSIIKGAKMAAGAGVLGATAITAAGVGAFKIGRRVVRKIGHENRHVDANLTGIVRETAQREKDEQRYSRMVKGASKGIENLDVRINSAETDKSAAEAQMARSKVGSKKYNAAEQRKIAAEATITKLTNAKNVLESRKSGWENNEIAKLRGTGQGSIYEARKEKARLTSKAKHLGYKLDEGGLIKHGDGFLGRKATFAEAKDEFGNVITDHKGRTVRARDPETGRPVVNDAGGGIRGLGSRIGLTLGGLGSKFAEEFTKSVSWSGLGKHIGDGIAKSLKNGTESLGLDKLTKDLMGVAGELRQTTFKAPDKSGLADKEGDKLTKEVAKKQADRDEAMTKLLKEIAENTKPKSGSNP